MILYRKTLINLSLLLLTYFSPSSILLYPFKITFPNQPTVIFSLILYQILIKSLSNLYLSKKKSKSKTTKIVVNLNFAILLYFKVLANRNIKKRSLIEILTLKTPQRSKKSKSKILRIQKIITSTRNKIKIMKLNLQKLILT